MNALATPVVIDITMPELHKHINRPIADILPEIRELAARSELTREIVHFLVHPDFPVDIRHNAKIFREKLAVWAKEQVIQ